MNKELHCITNKEKAAKNEWKNDDSDILRASYSFYIKKIRQLFFHTYSLTCLNKDTSVLLKDKNIWTSQ